MPKVTEAYIESRLEKMVKERGGVSYKFVSPNNPGVPDRIVLVPDGRVIFVELKTEKNDLQRIQRYQIGRMRECNADVRVIKGLDAAKEFVKEVFGE